MLMIIKELALKKTPIPIITSFINEKYNTDYTRGEIRECIGYLLA